MAPKSINSIAEWPDWAVWLQAGITALLGVVFLVIVGKMRNQGDQIQRLKDRVQGIENARAIEQSSGLDQQLRLTVERLQSLEQKQANLSFLSRENNKLKEDLKKAKDASNIAPLLAPSENP